MRKSRYVRRGLAQRVQKHKIRIRPNSRDKPETNGFESGMARTKFWKFIKELAIKSSNFLNCTACNLYVAPVHRIDQGIYILAPWKRRVIFYVFASLWVTLTLYKLHCCAQLLAQGVLHVETYLSFALFAGNVIPLFVAIPCILKPAETVQLLNSCEAILHCVGTDAGKKLTACDSPTMALKVLGISAIINVIAFDCTLLTLIFRSLPPSLFSSARRFGLLGDNVLPDFIWQIFFLPLEFASYLLPVLSSAFAGQLFTTTVGTYGICVNEIRKISIADVDSRDRVENLYRYMQVFNQGFLSWMKVALPHAIFALSFGFILTMYVTVRDTELPTLAYCGFPAVGTFFMGIIFWVSYDAVMAKRASEEILGDLQSGTSAYMQQLDPLWRKELLRRAKAFRPAVFPNGGFGEMTFELPVTVWEESVDQLLVLLTL